MKNTVILFEKQIGNTKVFPLAIEGFLYLLKNNLTENNQLIQDNYKCFWTEFNGKPIGCIVFDTYDQENIWIYLMYVQPKYQNEKVFSNMFTELLFWCRNNGIKYIKEGTSVNNKETLDILQKFNFEKDQIIHKLRVK